MSYTRDARKGNPRFAYRARVSPTDWSWSGEALVARRLAAGYLLGTTGARGERWRAASFLGGCALLVVALVTPLDTLARGYLVWGHLLQNVVFAEWAPLLLVFGVPAALGERLASRRGVRVTDAPVRRAARSGSVPTPSGTCRRSTTRRCGIPHTLLALEHATYLASGILFWWCVWQDEPHRLASGARAATRSPLSSSRRRSASCSPSCPAALRRLRRHAPERVWGLSV